MIGKQIAQQLAGAGEAEFDGLFTRVLHAGDLGMTHAVPGGEDENLSHVLRELRDGLSEAAGQASLRPPAVPEPATWMLLVAGFVLVGAATLRHRPERFPALAPVA